MLFMAKESGNAGDFTIEVIEPVPGIVSEEYRLRLAQAGYQTPVESARRLAEAQRQFTEKQARIGERGTKVCRDAPPVKLVGFVEDTNQDKIKVLVSARYVAGMLTGGFNQYLIWEPKQSWRVCD
ncbi:hypothetical protein [Chitinimonas sp. JJ19]|uniref:hypothetical protein n=1 Tax=Chitinimonas sp. JJ19 TaxID=3109352 RepID=UPI003002066F